MSTTDYQLGQRYEIAPFGRSDIVKDSIQMATFVGYIQKTWGGPSQSSIKWPVFEALFFSRPILYALDNGLCAARGESIQALMEDFGKMHAFYGIKHESIDVDHGKTHIPTAAFIVQMMALGYNVSQLTEDLNWGRYFMRWTKGEEIKYCFSCKAMRQTSCSACGCGSCKTCGYRWVCCVPLSLIPPALDLTPPNPNVRFAGMYGFELNNDGKAVSKPAVEEITIEEQGYV